MYFSKEQIEQSLAQLDKISPFFGSVFLAFKQANLPVGRITAIKFTPTINNFLQTYHYYYRSSSDPRDYRIYNPFKSSKKDSRWNKEPYSNSLHRTTETFADALDNQKNNQWGWKTSYIEALQKNHLRNEAIPMFDLAVWLFRGRNWADKTSSQDVIHTFITEFNISQDEFILFDLSVPDIADAIWQSEAVDDETLITILGSPLMEGAIIQSLKLEGVGPAKQAELDLKPRLNLLTGDNGLGKTFLLESAWWALTGVWASYPARPREDAAKKTPKITFQIGKDRQPEKEEVARYNWDKLEWVTSAKHEILAGLSIFAQADGSFIVWDPAKYRLAKQESYGGRGNDAMIRFSRSEIWNGVIERDQLDRVQRVLCDGLIHDWVRWQEAADKKRFQEFEKVLHNLSPGPVEGPLTPGKPTKMLETGDRRDIPTLHFPYGDVPILLCSAGIQQIVALAYLLVWAWQSHLEVAASMRREPERSIVLLIDEMEAHLHPYWQRTIVPALLEVVNELARNIQVQMIIATHSPLVLASVEPLFDDERDALFHCYLNDNGAVELDRMPFIKRGSVDKWLMSDIFGLALPRSKDAEEAIEAAKELQRQRTPSKEEVQEVSNRLLHVLAQDDDFWPRWTYFAEQRGASL